MLWNCTNSAWRSSGRKPWHFNRARKLNSFSKRQRALIRAQRCERAMGWVREMYWGWSIGHMGEEAGDDTDKGTHHFCGKPYKPEKEEVYLVSNGMILMSYSKAGKL